MHSFVRLTAAAALLAAGALAQAAVIDTFSDGQAVADHYSGDGGGGWSQSAFSAGILGGYREMYVEKVAPSLNVSTSSGIPGIFSLDATSIAQGGKYATNAPDDVTARSVIRWDGIDTLGQTYIGQDATVNPALGYGLYTFNEAAVNTTNVIADLLAYGNTFNFVYSADHDVTLKIEVWSPAGGYAFIEDTLLSTGGVDVAGSLPIGLLAGLVDLNNITALQLTVNGDGAVTELDFSFQPIEVPEPASLLLAGVALLGAGSVARRRKQK